MHLLGIAIHKIVERNETPSHARGSAAFSDGNIMEFHANLHYPKNYAITIIPRNSRAVSTPTAILPPISFTRNSASTK